MYINLSSNGRSLQLDLVVITRVLYRSQTSRLEAQQYSLELTPRKSFDLGVRILNNRLSDYSTLYSV